MGHEAVEVLRRPKVSSKVPAAPWDPTTLTTTSRAAHAIPAGTDEVVVGELDELPVEGVPWVVGVVLRGDEHAANPSAPIATATSQARRALPHRPDRRRADVVRS
jgi:hypothetical protein